jgi:sulfite reductase beta subunit-like hemoprotein
MVSVQTFYEKPLLHYLPHIQLGSSDDVHADAVSEKLLLEYTCDFRCNSMACMGDNVCTSPRTFLVQDK